MKHLIFISLFVFSMSLNANDRIINGSAIKGSQAPWQISLKTDKGTHFCGAALITKRVLLTAAHCVWLDSPGDIRIRGNLNSGKLSSLSRLPSAKKIIIHPKFKRQDFTAHDLAIIILNSDITETENLKPAPMFSSKMGIKVDQDFHTMTDWTFFTSGWGVIKPPNLLETPSEQLMGINQFPLATSNISILDEEIQEYLYKHYEIGPNTIARIRKKDALTLIAEGPENYGGTCSGDSGGPLVATKDGQTYLIGVSSYTAGGEKRCTGVSVYTNVQAYEDWILSEIE